MALNAQEKGRHGDKNSMDCPKFGRGMNMNHNGRMPFFIESEKMKKELNLTDEQVAKIQEINSEFKNQTDSIHEKQKALHEKMRKLDDDDKSTISDYEKVIKEMSANRTEIQILHAKYRIEIRSVLTKEQKEKLKAKHDKMIEKEKSKRHRHNDSED
jgi:Spy/CpxP family protein refolding chaperone